MSGPQKSELLTKIVRSGNILCIQQKRTTTTGGYPPPNDDDDPLPGLQESLGLQRRQHHTMSCMNENAVSLLLRLKQAVLFEDSATRHVATVALCMVRERERERGHDVRPFMCLNTTKELKFRWLCMYLTRQYVMMHTVF